MGSSQPLLDPLVGSTIGRYLIQARIGEGGMGTVYRAEQTPLGRPVALKVIHRSLTSDQKVVSRFLREAKIACQLTNPHTVTIFEFGDEDGVLYLAMELLQGESLHERLTRGPVEPVRAAEIAAQVCRSLTEAHKKGIIHRDLKPDNIFLSTADDGTLLVKVLDYGLARVMSSDDAPHGIQATLTQIGTIVGTPIYMSPEQARGRKLDTRTDLYSMGVVLFEMLSGVAPFLDEDAVVVLGKHIRDPVPRIESKGAGLAPPPALQVLVDKLLEKEPSKRPPDPAWVYQELRAYLSQAKGDSVRMPAVEAPVPTAPAVVPRITPPDADSGVQPRVEEQTPPDEWADTAATGFRDPSRDLRASPPRAAAETFALQPTVVIEPPEREPSDLPDVPTTVRADLARDPPTQPRALPLSPAPSAPTPPPAPSEQAVPGMPALSLATLTRPRMSLRTLALAVGVLSASAVGAFLVLRRGSDRVVVVTPSAATPPARGTAPPAASGAAGAPAGARSPGASTPAAGPSTTSEGDDRGTAVPAEPATAPAGLTPRVPDLGWSGSFTTSRGTVVLTERGDLVTGRFGDAGTLHGRPEDAMLRFTWSERAERGEGVVRSYVDTAGRTVLRGTFQAADPSSEGLWSASQAPGNPRRTIRRRPGKRPGGGLIYGNDILFGPRRPQKRIP